MRKYKSIIVTAVRYFIKHRNKSSPAKAIEEHYYSLNKNIGYSVKNRPISARAISSYLFKCSWFDSQKKGGYAAQYLLSQKVYDILKNSELSEEIFKIRDTLTAYEGLEELLGKP